MKLSIYSLVLVNFLGSVAAAVATKSGQVNESQQQEQGQRNEQQQQQQSQTDQRQHQQQQHQQQQIQPLIPQVVRSVNPSSLPTDKLEQQQQQASLQGLGALLAALPMDSRPLLWPYRAAGSAVGGDQRQARAATAPDDNNEQHQPLPPSPPQPTPATISATTTTTTVVDTPKDVQSDKRFEGNPQQLEQDQMPLALGQEDVMNLLLQELQTLDIEAINGAALRGVGEPNLDRQRGQQLQQGAATGSDLTSAVVAAANNRLRGRSAFLMNVGNHQVAPASLVLTERGGGVVGYPKRAANSNNRHVPCFFNAITCF